MEFNPTQHAASGKARSRPLYFSQTAQSVASTSVTFCSVTQGVRSQEAAEVVSNVDAGGSPLTDVAKDIEAFDGVEPPGSPAHLA
ncbi:hypothetical protein BH18ACT4_BH18ACT4_00480 [soil metagenome]